MNPPKSLTVRAALLTATLFMVLAASCKRDKAADLDRPQEPAKTSSSKAASTQKPAEPAANPALDAEDLSGRWDCAWKVPEGSGTETWLLVHKGDDVHVNFTGKDPAGAYAGWMNGTKTGSAINLSYEYSEGIKGSTKMVASKGGRVLQGDSAREKGDVVSRFHCTRHVPTLHGVDYSGRWECLWSAPGKHGGESWLLFHDESDAVRATVSGADSRGKYVGALSGKLDTNGLSLRYTVGDNAVDLVLPFTANRALVSGEVATSRTNSSVRYACARL